jgi:RNA polymerase sigma-70 factor (ECF subfamily)
MVIHVLTALLSDASTLTNEEEKELIEAARHDRAAFAPLYRRYVTAVYRYFAVRVGNQETAEDLTAQLFTELLTTLSNYREQGSFAGWLFTIARRRLIDHYRQNKVELPLEHAAYQSGSTDVCGDFMNRLQQEQLLSLVAELDEDQKELLALRFASGLTFAQIGEAVGKSEAACKMATSRLLKQLQILWEVRYGR